MNGLGSDKLSKVIWLSRAIMIMIIDPSLGVVPVAVSLESRSYDNFKLKVHHVMVSQFSWALTFTLS